MALRRVGSAGVSRCSGMPGTFVCWTHALASYSGNTCAMRAAAIASKMRIGPNRLRSARSNCWAALTAPAPRSGHSAAACIRPTVRHILGVLSLAKKYGGATVDDACAAALEVGVCQYRFVRRYLERRPQMPLSLRQVDPLIRQLTLYRDFIQERTKENTE